jgi:hypothetical protein
MAQMSMEGVGFRRTSEAGNDVSAEDLLKHGTRL